MLCTSLVHFYAFLDLHRPLQNRSGYADPDDSIAISPEGGFQNLYSLPQGKGPDPTYSVPVKGGLAGANAANVAKGANGYHDPGSFYSEVDVGATVGATQGNGPRSRPVSDVTYATVDHGAQHGARPGSGDGRLYAEQRAGAQGAGHGTAATNDQRMGEALYGTPTAFPNGGTGSIPFHSVLSSEESTAL